ncbi:hypothetical protein Cgig2_004495 [Carnegiea gigantea]|uniref:DUF4283 domain-containing protein n=1 Tax=Carnegiea gigantea TaxID=171969 RepID=A0A9Q1JRL0_9CARY|nr:hypothetical protein Cgig2_004495 [Carnegiea gigantea]
MELSTPSPADTTTPEQANSEKEVTPQQQSNRTVQGQGQSSARVLPTFASLVDPNGGTGLEFIPATKINGTKCPQLNVEDIEDELPELDIKYWGMQSLSKIGSLLGCPLRTDKYTKEKSMLKYARLMVEMPLEGHFPEYIEFANEKGLLLRQKVIYEWLPIKCDKCKIFRHTHDQCRKQENQRKELRVKAPVTSPEQDQPSKDAEPRGEDGYQLVTRHTTRHIVSRMEGITAPMEAGMVGFSETKDKEPNIQQVMSKVCANWKWEHNAIMTEKGRIILSWHPRKYHFSPILKTDQLLHGEVMHLLTNRKFFLTLVYGRNLEDQRLPLWEALGSITLSLEDPWCPKSSFQFCEIWTKDKGFKDIVKQSLAQQKRGSNLKAL